jgi:hypothetical protein
MRQGRHEALSRGMVLAAAGLLAAATAYASLRALRARRERLRPVFDYSDRSGFPRPPAEMRGIARNLAPNRGQSPVSLAINP